MLDPIAAPPQAVPDAPRPRWWERAWPIAVIGAVLAIYFGPAIAEGVRLMPHDGVALNYPSRLLWSEALRQGELPFWNPYVYGGIPLLAAVHPGVFYPGNWFFLALPPVPAWLAVVTSAYLLAGLFAYAFGRALTLARPAALVVALTFMLSGFLAGHLEQLQMVQAAAWLPALLWAIERFRRTLAPRYALAGCVALALQILAGFPMVTALSLLVAGPYAVWRAWGLGAGDARRYALALVGALALGVGLCAAQLLPALDFIPLTQRQAMDYTYLTWHSLHPRQLIMYWLPFLFGGPVSWLSPTPFWGLGPYLAEITGYVGLGGLALATVAVLGRIRDGATRFWLAVAGVALVLSFGRYTPLYHLWALLPVLKTMPGAGRHALEVDMALAVLAGYGFQHLLGAPHRLKAAMGGVAVAALPVLAVAAAVAVAGPMIAGKFQPFMPAHIDVYKVLTIANPGVWWPLAMAALLAVTLFAVARRPSAIAQTALVAALLVDLVVFGQHIGWRQLDPRPGDALVTQAPSRPAEEDRQLAVSRFRYPYEGFAHVDALHYAMVGAVKGDRSVNGYDSFYYARYGKLLGIQDSVGMLKDPTLWAPSHHFLDMVTTRWLRLDAELLAQPEWRDRLTPDRWRPLSRTPEVAVFENTRRLPRAWRPTELRTMNASAVDAHIRGVVPWDPRQTALVEPDATPSSDEFRGFPAGSASAQTLSLNRIAVETEAPAGGLVIVSENFDPGWRAVENGTELPVRRVDGTLIGVEVPAGRHAFELRYTPRLWGLGLLGSGLSLLLLAAWALRTAQAGRRFTRSHG